MELKGSAAPDVSWDLVEYLRRFPTERSVQRCDTDRSRARILFELSEVRRNDQLRPFGGTEIEDLFDAVFEWMNQPGAESIVRRRREAIAEHADSS
jgi:hypothetical protein